MDYTMEDTQNSAPDALEATKLNTSGQRTETQSVTKRLVDRIIPSRNYSFFTLNNADLVVYNV